MKEKVLVKRSQKRILFLLSVIFFLIDSLMISANAACLHSTFSNVDPAFNNNKKSYPANTKGVVYLAYHTNPYHYGFGRIKTVLHTWVKNGGKRYLLSSIPVALTEDMFSILDKTTGEKLTPELIRLRALDDYPINTSNNIMQGSHYYVNEKNVIDCNSNNLITINAGLKKWMQLGRSGYAKHIENNELSDVSQQARKAWGYFRVEPKEGMKPEHTYEFRYKSGDHENLTRVEISKKPVNLDEISKIEPIEFQGYREPFFAYWTFNANRSIYSRSLRYYIPPSLQSYDTQLQVVSLLKGGEEYSFKQQAIFYDNGVSLEEFFVKPFRGSFNRGTSDAASFYPLSSFSCFQHKAKVGFLEVEDKLFDTKTRTLFCGELNE